MWQLVYCEKPSKKSILFLLLWLYEKLKYDCIFSRAWLLSMTNEIDFILDYLPKNALGGVDQIATFHEQHRFQHWNPALNAALLKSSDVPTRAIKTRYIKKLYQIHFWNRPFFLKSLIKKRVTAKRFCRVLVTPHFHG